MATSLLGARSRQGSPEENAGGVSGNAGGTSGGDSGPPGGGRGPFRGSWAEMLSSTLPTCWNKNVLEVILEKDERGSFTVSDTDCARVMRKIGLDSRPGVHVECIQICPNGRGIILITLKKELPIETFCRHDVFDVTSTGIRAINIKPAGKREVVVQVKNIHPNTMDDGVVDYLNKFGRVVTKKVIYGVFSEGPLKGFRNGDRSYKMEIKPNMNIGTYHVLDGQKITVRYPGQLQTCARCHETARTCRGKGMARRCEAEGGQKVELSEYIMKLWKEIGYSPENVEMVADLDEGHGHEIDSGLVQQEGGKFTPIKVPSSDHDKFTGISLKTFPKDTDQCQIVELLHASGLPITNMDEIVIKPNGVVSVRNLDNSVCLALINALHNQKHFGRKLFCNGIIPLTPEKLDKPPGSPATDTTGNGTAAGSSNAPSGTAVSSASKTGEPLAASVAAAISDAPSVSSVVSSATLGTAPIMTGQSEDLLGLAPFTNHTSSPLTACSTPKLGSLNLPFIASPPVSISLNPLLFPAPCPTVVSNIFAAAPNFQANLDVTSAKVQAVVTTTQVHSSPKSSPLELSTVSSYSSPPHYGNPFVSPFSPPNQSLLDIGTSMDIQRFVEDHHLKLANNELVRRHSRSLRSPPPGSLAADILQASSSVTPHFDKAKSLLVNLKEMTNRLSEFESCRSSGSSSSSSEDEQEVEQSAKDTDDEGFKTMNDRKRSWKLKRKNSTTPSKDSFVKKLNQNSSPQY